jgi:hypothetical protein
MADTPRTLPTVFLVFDSQGSLYTSTMDLGIANTRAEQISGIVVPVTASVDFRFRKDRP